MTGAWGSGFRRWWWLLVVGAVVGTIAGWATVSRAAAAQSISSAEIVITGQLSEDRVDSALTSNQYVNQRMSTYVRIVTSELVVADAAQRAGLDPGSLAGSVGADNPLGTTILTITVQASTPEEAQGRNQAVVAAATAQIEATENPAGRPPRIVLTTITAPSLPEPATAPSPILGYLVGGLIGAAAGAALLVAAVSKRRRQDERRRQLELAFEEAARPATRHGVAPSPGAPNGHAARRRVPTPSAPAHSAGSDSSPTVATRRQRPDGPSPR